MNETPQQYIQRILGHVQGKDAMKVQATTPKKLAALIKNVSPSKLRKRPAPDKWSVTEILGTPRRRRDRYRVAYPLDPGRAGNADPGLRPGRMGRRGTIQRTQSPPVPGSIPRSARSKSDGR